MRLAARRTTILLGLALAATLAVPAAQAVYIATPLRMDPDGAEGNVGDAITFTVTPSEDWDGPSYAGKTVTLWYNWDSQEGQHPPAEDPDQAVSNDENASDPPSTHVERQGDAVALDDASRATFTWTIPAEVDDRNVFLTLRDENGDVVANGHVRVGDAEPMAFLMAEGGGGKEVVQEPPGEDPATDHGPERNAPGPGALLVGLGLAGAALVALRRRG